MSDYLRQRIAYNVRLNQVKANTTDLRAGISLSQGASHVLNPSVSKDASSITLPSSRDGQASITFNV